MAADARARPNKPMNVTFTLPISCQICLGKVKQPVLCPNHHVFCSLCLDIWLRRNQQCPACRVDIGPDNPVKHIIGSQVEDDTLQRKSNPELRRARFDLLYQEYEEELEQLRKENIVLRTENNILVAQLKDAEDKSTAPDDDKKVSIPDTSHQTPENSRLLVLARNLQEAQKLYQNIKVEMSELKRENLKLKDESALLTRENESLRLEVAQRSPKKYGRYTVATLETKIAEQEKEIRQLKKALERSDSYIEELQQGKAGGRTIYLEKPASSGRFLINLEPKPSSSDKKGNPSNELTETSGPRKVLFGKVIHEEVVKTDHQANVFSAISASHSFQKHAGGQGYNLADEHDPGSLQHVDFQSKPAASSHCEVTGKKLCNDESYPASNLGGLQSQSHSGGTGTRVSQDKPSKKVHFKNSQKPSDGSSFDLELPSPISSLISESCSSVSKDLPSPGQNLSCESESFPRHDSQVKMEVPSHGEDEYGGMLLGKHAPTSNDFSGFETLKSKTTNITRKKLKASAASKKLKQELIRKEESDSYLSVPDMTASETIDDLADASGCTEQSSNFDLSMTPEMTDCLRLISQAEKKVSSMTDISSALATKDPATFPISQTHHSSNLCQDSVLHRPSLPPRDVPTTLSIGVGHGFSPAGGSISSWEQQFYNSLKVNPFKFTSGYKSPDFSGWLNQKPLSNYTFGHGNRSTIHTHMDLKPAKDLTSNNDFKFSEPIKVPVWPNSLPGGVADRKLSNPIQPVSLYLSIPDSSSSSVYPSSSSFHFAAPTSAVPIDTLSHM